MDACLQGLESDRASNTEKADSWVEEERWPDEDSDVYSLFPHTNVLKTCSCVYFCLSSSHIYLPFFYPSLDSISLSLISPHPLNFSPEATVCVHPVAAATAGGHTSWWVNKRPRDPSSAEGWKIKFHFFFPERWWREGGGLRSAQRGAKNMKRWWRGDGWMDGVGEMSS